ncbi:MAG: inositol monophosphatase family protein [Elusimicrobia bacterium]|jgi:myo-inositol-1(or 4)-monophosphatase|nr:inositol monophosphatase family protein [Elusimicrobiota bacterium]
MGNNNNKIYAEVAKKAAKEAGKLLLKNFAGPREISYKGRINLVTKMDTESEKLIVNIIRKNFPGHSILAEEGEYENIEGKFRWVIDPLDGTSNYAHGFGFFCVSIALQNPEGQIIAGAVYAPYLNEFYMASKGAGAFLNGKDIKVSEIKSLERSMLATGFPYDIAESRGNIDNFNKFLLKTQAVRRPGAAALDLCSVAAGKFDGFWEMELNPWDTAAGVLIVTEAGGKVTDFDGGKYSIYDNKILVSNGIIHNEMQEMLNE